MATERWLTRPMAEFIRTVAVSVAEGQEALDRRSRRMQVELDQAKATGELDYDLDASWLRFSDVEASIEVMLSIEGEEIRDPTTNDIRAYRPVVTVAPIGLGTKRTHDIDADIASEVTLRISPAPPEAHRQ